MYYLETIAYALFNSFITLSLFVFVVQTEIIFVLNQMARFAVNKHTLFILTILHAVNIWYNIIKVSVDTQV